MRARFLVPLLIGYFSCTAIAADQLEQIREYFREIDLVCQKDGGALWGKKLCGPVLLVNPTTHEVFANQRDQENRLQKRETIFTGTLPSSINIANTATDWAGVKWTMIMLPLPENRDKRAALFAHEMWHRIQEQLGFASSGATNDHLDTRDGRYWLQLEWRALAAALRSKGPAELAAITDAEIFRARRHQLFPKSTEEERSMEINEGLAEYTGIRLCGTSDPRQFVVDANLKDAPAKQTFVRSFAYASGPAYGLLLDEVNGDWRKNLQSTNDLAELLMNLRHITLPENVEALATDHAPLYGAHELAASEDAREKQRAEQEKKYVSRFTEGPVLVIPLEKMNMQFDPRTLVPLKNQGTVYPEIRIVDTWGILEVKKGGALLSSDFAKVTVPPPENTEASNAKGDGWKLTLNDGWKVCRTGPNWLVCRAGDGH